MNPIIKHNYSYLYLLPGLFIFGFFFVLPSLGSFYYAFTNWNGVSVSGFVGWDNFKSLFNEENTWLAFKNTFIFTFVTTVFKILLGLMLALFVNMKLRMALQLRSILFFPDILSNVAVALTFAAIYHPEFGLLNEFLRFIHLDSWTKSWITDTGLVMYSISAVEIWKYVGFNMVLFLAALQAIPKDIYESSMIDGANAWQKFRSITLPLIVPMINVNVILSLIGGLKVFDIVYALTGGGPGSASNVITTVIYKDFARNLYGEAMAANVVLFLIIVIFVVIVNHALTRKETEV